MQLYKMKDEGRAEETKDDVTLNIRRINDYVEKVFAVHGKGNRDAYKDELVFQTRREVITDFLKYAMLKKCSNCSACVVNLPARLQNWADCILGCSI